MKKAQKNHLDQNTLLATQNYLAMRRMKTVFAHQNHETEEGHSIYNAIFSKEGDFVISGADDG